MESYIDQLDFSAAFDGVSHCGLLFKLNSIGVGGSVLSICCEFISNRRQRVVVDVATSDWIPIVSGFPQGSVLGHLLFILRGKVDDLSFLEYLSPFCFLSIEFHGTFSISYKIVPYFVYYYCILVMM